MKHSLFFACVPFLLLSLLAQAKIVFLGGFLPEAGQTFLPGENLSVDWVAGALDVSPREKKKHAVGTDKE